MDTSEPLRASVTRALQTYFEHLGEQVPTDLYKFVLEQMETPLLEMVMKQVKGNQSKAAHMLGLSRGTLRKLLKRYGLL